jgi:hypothetical protein
MALGAWLAVDQDLLHPRGDRMGSLGRALPALFSLEEMLAVEPRQPLPRDAWLDEVEVMVARDRAGSSAGLYVAAKGGHNAESHNHNDVGNFVVYVDGRPLLVDAGVETYTRKTFSAERYDIWTMQSAYHSLLPTIDGIQQAPGRSFAAGDTDYGADGLTARLSLDLAGAYPPEAKLKSWRRTITLHRGQDVEVVDGYELEEPADEITLSLLTPCTVRLAAPGQVVLSEAPLPDERRAGRGVLSYDAERFALTTEVISIADDRLGGVWGKELTRLVFAARNPAQQDTWTFRVQA